MRRSIAVLIACAVALGPSAVRADEPRVDGSFGDSGVARADLPGDDFATHVVVDPRQRVVVAGITEDRAGVVRFAPDGSLDRSFGGDGKFVFARGRRWPAGLAIGRDGAIYVALSIYEPEDRFGVAPADDVGEIALDRANMAIAKLRDDGSIDRSFGQAGFAYSQTDSIRPLADGAAALALGPDGSLVLLGVRVVASLGYYGAVYEPVLLRFTPLGQLDETFGVGGITPVAPGALPGPVDVAVQRDGKIVVGATLYDTAPAFSTDWMFYRYLPSGLADASYGTAGVARVDLSETYGWDFLRGMVLQPDGRILAYGSAGDLLGGSGSQAAAVRLDPTGRPDRSFGVAGVVKLRDRTWLGEFTAAAVQADGRTVVAKHGMESRRWRAELLRLTPDGDVDDAFGRTPVPFSSIVVGMGLQPRRVVAALSGIRGDGGRGGFVVFAARR